MAGYTKEQYDEQYVVPLSPLFGGHMPSLGQSMVKLHYHRWAIRPLLLQMYQTLQPILQLQPSDFILVAGCGFGWGVEGLIAATGATVVGTDISAYVQAEKNQTELAELRQIFIDAGFDPDSGQGLEMMNAVYDGQPRSNVIVLNEDAQTNTSRQAIRAALNNNWPNVCIAEDIIDENTTDAEITQVNNAFNLFAGNQRIIWVCSNDYPNRSFAQLQALVGAEVISRDGRVYLGGP